MMNSHFYKKTALLILLLVFCLAFTACGKEKKDPEPVVPEVPVLPEELALFRDNVTLIAANEAENLSGSSFVTAFSDMLSSGSGTSYKEYANLKATLDQLSLTYGAFQTYVLTDMDDDITSLEVAVASNTNGGAPICTWMEHHKAEYALLQASSGKATGDMFARTWSKAAEDGTDVLTWTAYAPLLDANGQVVAILAFEYPKPDFLKDYPEWNRMSSVWNGVIEPAGE